jgi:hypothetical protein
MLKMELSRLIDRDENIGLESNTAEPVLVTGSILFRTFGDRSQIALIAQDF